jgi:hypothetical protein
VYRTSELTFLRRTTRNRFRFSQDAWELTAGRLRSAIDAIEGAWSLRIDVHGRVIRLFRRNLRDCIFISTRSPWCAERADF